MTAIQEIFWTKLEKAVEQEIKTAESEIARGSIEKRFWEGRESAFKFVLSKIHALGEKEGEK